MTESRKTFFTPSANTDKGYTGQCTAKKKGGPGSKQKRGGA